MKTIDTRGLTAYSPLIPAMKAICNTPSGEQIEIILDNKEAFHDLKEFLSEEKIGFREIYTGEEMTLQFSIK